MEPARRRQLNEHLCRLAQGERDAARPLFDALWPELRAFCRAALRDAPEAEDVAQEALLKVFSQASRFDPDRDALAWAIELAAWEVRTQRRRTTRSREDMAGESMPDRADARPDAGVLLDGKRAGAALGEAYDSLSPTDREVVRIVLEDAEPPVEGATWRKRKERALKRLQSAWRAIHAGE